MEEEIKLQECSNETVLVDYKSFPDDQDFELDLVGELNYKGCQIMKTGYKMQTMLFYFCSCDPDQKQPMCQDCYLNCHADHPKSKEISYELSAVCNCGMNYHRISDLNKNDDFYNKQCLFMEWSRISGKGLHFINKDTKKIFCIFCAIFCNNHNTTLIKNLSQDVIECSCFSHNHYDAKSTLKKLSEIENLKKIQLNNFTQTHVINLIIGSENSFNNIFKKFIEYLQKIQIDVDREWYNIDSNIGYSTAMKSLETLYLISESMNGFYYFGEVFDGLLEKKFIFSLLEKKFDYKTETNIWYLKNFVFGLYLNFIVYRDFEKVPKLSFKDIENLHPLQRLIFIKSIHSLNRISNEYFKTSNIDPLEQIINIIEKINSINEKNEITYEILGKCYKICRIYASYNRLSVELGRYCTINDDVISSIGADKKIIPHGILLSQLKVIIQMVKSISYCAYFLNDDLLEKFLNNQKDVNDLNFFHSNSYDAKLIYKNCINLLNFVRNCRKSLDLDNNKFTRKNQHRKTILDFKFYESKKNISKLENQTDEIERLLRKILVYSTNITSIVINNPENYKIGFSRLLQKDMDIYINFIEIDKMNKKDFEIFKKMTEIREILDEKISGFFRFKSNEIELISCVIKSLESYKELILNNIPNSVEINLFYKSKLDKISYTYFKSLTKNLYFLLSKESNEKKELLKLQTAYSKSKGFTEKNSHYINQESLSSDISKLEISKFQILTTKSLLVFSIIKAMKILIKSKEDFKNDEKMILNIESIEKDTNTNTHEFLIQEIKNFLCFLINDNPDNCMIILSEEILDSFCLLEVENVHHFLELLEHILTILNSQEVHVISHNSLLKAIKVIMNKISLGAKYLHLLEKLLNIIKIFSRLPSINPELKFSKIRAIMKSFFTKNPILNEFKFYLIESSSLRHLKIKSKKTQNYQNIKENGNLDLRNFNPNINQENIPNSISEKFYDNLIHQDLNVDYLSSDRSSPKENNHFDGLDINSLFNLYYKFLKLINFLFDGNATLNENQFLSKILRSKEIPKILRKKDLALELRTEILKFFRMTDIDVIIDPEGLESYRSIFINNIIIPEDIGMFEDGQNFKIFNDLLIVNQNSLKLGLESSVIKYELKFFEKIVNETGLNNKEKILNYFEFGIMLPLIVFLNKFMSIIFYQKGIEYLKLYEIVIYFLKTKQFLIENIPKIKEELTFWSSSENKILIQLANYLKLRKNNFSLINKNFTKKDLTKVKNDLEILSDPKFEILNCKLVFSYFEEHIKGFLYKPNLNSLISLFDKKDLNYTNEDLKNLHFEFKQAGYLKIPFEKKIFEGILKYENDKNKFSESSFIHNLGEINNIFDSNYRAIILKTIFFLVKDKKMSEKYRKQNFWNLFKLLQNDTNPTQTEIYSLYLENQLNVNFEHIIDIFLKNLLSIIFASCNPTSLRNEDYFIAMMILKILKYMCEDHNENFQTIFFKELKFDCYRFEFQQAERPGEAVSFKNINSKVNMFDLLLGIVGKIIILAQWEKINFEANDRNQNNENFEDLDNCRNFDNYSSAYFYDIFFTLIELLIEMVQGTKSENLESISIQIGSPFFNFLQNVKGILLKDKNDSPIIYKVRKDLIEFIVSFLEEKSTPKRLVNMISSIYNPFSIFDCIVNTLKKSYIKNSPKLKESIQDYEEVLFDHKKCEFFVKTYFKDKFFCQTPEFILANRLYQYVKILATQFKYEDALSIINTNKQYKESELIKYITKRKKLKQNNLIPYEIDTKEDNCNNDIILDDSFIQNYFALKFFEKITRTVHVKKEEIDVMVLFTVNPLIPFLSSNTKTEFYENVNRETEYSKKLALIENCDYFYDEIIYNSNKMNNIFFRMLNKINYFYAEAGLFLLTFVINLYLLFTLDTTEKERGFDNVYPVVKALGSIQLILNALCLLAWFISKFPLYYIVEEKKFSQKIEKRSEELSIIQKLQIILYYTIIRKSETNGFLWNIIFSTVAISAPMNTFLFSVQLMSITNLSITLRNIVTSITLRYKQLLATSMFVTIMLYFFTCLAFYFLSQDFVFSVGDDLNQENQCGSLLYCFLTHLDWGLRTDGGIGEHLKKVLFYSNPGYFLARFFYEILFFIVMIIILLNIVFGMIIDTFAELREKSKHVLNDKKNICYICGGKRDYLERNCISFDEHVKIDHSIWTYAEYIIGLKFVDPQETNAINSYVIDMIENKKISWFPSIDTA